MSGSPPRRRVAIDLAQLRVALSGTMIENRYQPIARIADRQPIGLEALARLNHPEVRDAVAGPLRSANRRRRPRLQTDRSCVRPGVRRHGRSGAGGTRRPDVGEFPARRAAAPGGAGSAARAAHRPRHTGRAHHRRIDGKPPCRGLPAAPPLARPPARRGFGVAIDDAGPAVPWLTELLDLPFTSLKLDKDLVKQVTESEAIRRFIAYDHAQGKNRGMTIVAEGVETRRSGITCARSASMRRRASWWRGRCRWRRCRYGPRHGSRHRGWLGLKPAGNKLDKVYIRLHG